MSARAAGRSQELTALRSAYRAACEGEARLLVLDGPAATGKGALLDAWLAEHRAGPVLRVDARRDGTGGASPVERLVEAALDALSPVRRGRHSARALLERGESGPVADLMVAAERRLRLREEVARLLNEIGAANPAVVVLDGMERADRSTVELLTELVEPGAPWARRPDVLFVAAVDGAPAGPLAQLARSAAARTLTLRPLDRAGVRELLSSADVVDAVLEVTGGLPELIERLVRGEAIVRSEDHPQETREALEALALLDRPTPDALLEAVLGRGVDAATLSRAGAVRGADAWLLPPALRDRLRGGIDPTQANAVHRRAAAALADDEPASAARHALACGDLARAADLALRGADRLTRRHAAVDAAELVLEVVGAHDEADRPAPDDVRSRLVELLWIVGDHAGAVRQAERLVSERPRDAAAALRLGRLLAYGGRHAEAIEHLERAVSLADADSPERDEAETALADALYQARQLDRATALAERVSGASSDARLVLDAQNTLAKIDLSRGRLDAAEPRLTASLADARDAALPRHACQALNNLAIVAMARGELPRAKQWLEQMVELSELHGAVFYRGIAHKNLAVVKQLEGAWADALDHAERALSLLSGLGHASLVARLSFNTADLHRVLGDPYRALRLCAHARERAGDAIDAAVDCEGLRVEAAIHVELGHTGEARRAYERASVLAEGLGHAAARIDAQLGLAALAIDEGDTSEARAICDAVEAPVDARSKARLALLEARLAENDESIPLARFAVQAARETGDPLMEQPARLELARALADAGLPGRAHEELATLRRREDELARQVPEGLRQLFRERALCRRLAAVESGVGAAPTTERRASRGASVDAMVGTSAGMRELRGWIGRIGPSESSVLITGESGTGKELVAEALHAASARKDAPFLKVNCAALVDDLLSSELFGHERGAFTGADRQKKGRFELADGGTILLDEIGDISPRMQATLLRVLQERTFERVGGTRTMSVDVRILAATHRDLRAMVDGGLFREDLYYRLSGITVPVPSLRARRDDLPELCRHLLSKIAKEMGGEIKTVAPDALELLGRHDWPGNVRELENALRSVAVLSEGRLLTAADFAELAPRVTPSTPPPASGASLGALAFARVKDGGGSIYDLRKRIERECIERALRESDGNISKAAEVLGMKRPRLSKLVNEWGLK